MVRIRTFAVGLESMRYFSIILVCFLALSSCSEYQKALQSEDVALKYKMGDSLFNLGKYGKANRLFAQIAPQYRGKPQGQRLRYMYAKSFYEMRDYALAGYQFEQFENSYPQSEKAEEAGFLGAKSYYHLSPVYSKEQKETKEALQKLQLFINKYPESQYLSEANELIKELDYKLEKKAYEIAKQYNKIAYFESSDYEASIKAFENFLIDHPGSVFREDALFYRLDSAYQLAINSVPRKKEERLKRSMDFYNAYMKYFAKSDKYTSELQTMKETMTSELAQYTTKS